MKSGISQTVRAFWSERNPRERGMLVAAIAVMTIGLVYALLIDPAISGREDLQQRLPGLRQQAAELRALTREASAAGNRAATPVAPLTRTNVETSLTRRGLTAQEISVSADVTRVRFENASFANLVDWLSDMHRTSRAAVAEAKIEAKGEGAEADNVSAVLTLRQQRGDGQAQ